MWSLRIKQSWQRLLKMTLTVSISMLTCSALADPVLNDIAAGQVSVQQTPGTTIVNQSSQQAILNWQSFNIGKGESTHFNQPAGGIALNRINPTAGASQIYGSLTATGQIVLINPAGIYFGPSAYVNVGGMIASTSTISDQNFMNGLYQFSKVDGYNGAIVNEGMIIAAQNGLISLVAPSVINNGLIQAHLGKVILGSGETFTLNLSGDDLINFAINTSTSTTDKNGHSLSAGITNNGSLIADGGTIILSAKAAAAVLDQTINLQGVVQAKSVYQDKGTLIISGDTDKSIVNVAAKIDVSGKGAGEKGGTVHITGHNIFIDSPTNIDVSGDIGGGEVNIGGSYQGKGLLANANAVVMMPNAIINANAMTRGDGGNIVLWSNNITKFYGHILAQGGSESGNGGSVETSGKQYLDANGGYVNTLAANGNVGMWLLDPTNIYIATNQATATAAGMGGVDTTANTVNAGVFQASGAVQDSLLTTANLAAALGVSNVTVNTTNASGAGLGNINVVSAFTVPTARTLTLLADNNIVTTAAGIISLTGTSILNLTAGSSVATGGVTLNGNIRGTVAGGGTVNINTGATGAVTIGTALGATATFGSLAINSNGTNTTALNANVSTASTQTYNTPVVLGANVTLTTTNSAVTFGSTVNRDATARTLTVSAGTGAIELAGNVGIGGTGGLGAITLNSTGTTTIGGLLTAASLATNAGGSTRLNGGTITTTGTQTYGDSVVIGANTAINTTNAAVAFQSTINRDASATHTLTVNSGSGAQTYTGIIGGGINGAIGDMILNSTGVTTLTGNISANSLTTNAGGTLSIGASTINTTGNIAFGEATTFTTTSKTFTSSAGSISFGSTLAGGAQGLTVNSVTGTTVSGAVTGLANLTVNGPLSLNANITTTGTQTYNGAITLGGGITLTSTNSAITLNSTLDRDATVRNFAITAGSGAILVADNIGVGVNGALGTLTFNTTGATTIGGTIAASTIATNAGGTTTINGGSITTTGAQSYADAVTLGADTTLNSGAGAITFTSTLNSDATPRNLTINSSGTTTFTGIVGGVNPLNSITTDATGTTTFANNATIVGDMIFNDNVVSSGVAKVLTSNTGAITFNGTLTGTFGISLLSTTGVTFNQNVGLTSTAALTVTGPATINAATISTGGNQTWNDIFTFTQPLTTLTATGAAANINIVQPLNWANSNTLYIAATGATGTLTLPSTITTTNGGAIQLNANPAQNLADDGTIFNVSKFNLVRGTWSQVGLANIAFYAADFQLNSGGSPSSSTNFYRALGGDGTIATPYQIYDVYGLQGIGGGTASLTQHFILMNDLDMTPTNSWNSGTGWAPIGTATSVGTRLSGVFDGGNFTLDNLTMNKTINYSALFGYIQGGTVRNINLTNLSITTTGVNNGGIAGQLTGGALVENINISGSVSGAGITGGAVGRTISSSPISVNNVHFTGTVTSTGSVTGGLAGSIQNNNGQNGIANSSANAIVTGTNDVGGLIGEMQNNNADMYVTNSYATGSVTGATSVGGLIGRMQGNNSANPFINEIINSYSTSTVNGTTNVGGLVGQMRTTNINLLGFNTITNSFSSGQVNIVGTGTSIGGLVGYMNILSIINGSYSNVASIIDTAGSTNIGGLVGSNEGAINNSYSITSVTGQASTNNLGGLVANNAGTITNSYSIGSVTGNGASVVGGLVAINTGTVDDSYWNTDTSGLATSAGGSGLTTAQMQNQANYNNWDFATTWNIVDSQSYPFLRAFYAVAPRAISGTTNATSGTAVTFAANGTVLDTTYTGTNGSYYFLAGNNLISGINSSIADGTAILGYLNSNGLVGNTVTLAPINGDSISGFNIAVNGVSVGSNSVATLNTSTLSTALGALSGANFLYSVTGNNLTLGNNTTNDIAFSTTSNTTYSLTGDINSINGATSSSMTFNGLASADTILALSAATIKFMNGITGNNNMNVTGISGNSALTVKTASAPTFHITGLNSGNITGINNYSGLLNFSNIQNLTGSDNGNTFIISNNARISGVMNGANLASNNRLDLTTIPSNVAISLTSTNNGSIQTTNDFIGSFANITNINANKNYKNSISVPNNKINNIYITAATIGYINDPLYFDGVTVFFGTNISTVNFLTKAVYNPASGIYTVNGVPMTFTNFGAISGHSVETQNSLIQTPSIIVNVIQQPLTNANQNNNSPSSWALDSTSIDQNIALLTTDLASSYQNSMKKLIINPNCNCHRQFNGIRHL